MTFRIEIAAPLIPWPDGSSVIACAFIGFEGEEPVFVLSKGRTPYAALQGIFCQAKIHCTVTAPARN